MKLLPQEKFEIHTPLTLEEAVSALKKEVETNRWFHWWSSHEHAVFQGDISSDGFKIMRIIHYQNTSLPIIRGTFKPSQNGTNITIQMDLPPFSKAFIPIWLGFAIIMLFLNGVGLAIGVITLSSSPVLLIPFALIIFGWQLVFRSFWFEARKARSELLTILHGRIEPNLLVG